MEEDIIVSGEEFSDGSGEDVTEEVKDGEVKEEVKEEE